MVNIQIPGTKRMTSFLKKRNEEAHELENIVKLSALIKKCYLAKAIKTSVELILLVKNVACSSENLIEICIILERQVII